MGVNRRKTINYSVKRNMQIRLFLKVLSISLIGIALMAVIFYLYSNREINENYRQFHIHAQNFLDYLLPAVALSVLAAVFSAAALPQPSQFSSRIKLPAPCTGLKQT
jgi:hypothetical protein